jgi:hypothetical protein
MKFEYKDFHRNITEDELLADLKGVYEKLLIENRKLTFRSYDISGKYTAGTIQTRFGTWNNALLKAGIIINEEKNVTNEKLFQNIETIWIEKGSQPVYRDLDSAQSKYSASTYTERFGNWKNALKEFVKYINEDEGNSITGENVKEDGIVQDSNNGTELYKHITGRNISERMRFRVLARDGFTCQSCGASPIKERGVELHVDHIIPWSKGGETIESNLQTKCHRCNLGKGNAFIV